MQFNLNSTAALLLLLWLPTTADAFVGPVSIIPEAANWQKRSSSSSVNYRTHSECRTELAFFGRKRAEESVNDNEQSTTEDDVDGGEKVPFFARILGMRKNEKTTTKDVSSTSSSTATMELAKKETEITPPPPPPPMTPLEKAKALKAQAERVRLEAERLDAQLTLEKIERLESSITKAKMEGKSSDDFSRELENLQRKLRGEPPVAATAAQAPPAASEATTETALETTTAASSSIATDDTTTEESKTKTAPNNFTVVDGKENRITFSPPPTIPYNETLVQQYIVQAEQSSDEELKCWGLALGLSEVEYGNLTKLALATEEQSRKDASTLATVINNSYDESSSTQSLWNIMVQRMKKVFDSSFVSQISRYDLEGLSEKEMMNRLVGEALIEEGSIWSGFFKANSRSKSAEIIESFEEASWSDAYPKFMEKLEKPSEAQVNFVYSKLPEAGFVPSTKPTDGPYNAFVIPGKFAKDEVGMTGDKLIERLDSIVARDVVLRDKVTLCLVRDVVAVISQPNLGDENNDPYSNMAILVMGSDVAPPPNTIIKTLSTSLGLFTAWYAAVYPFLLNDGISKRVQEQIDLSNAGMQPNLEFLNDFSIPLFATFLACQFAHELGHNIVAGAYNMSTSVPTFVPSLATGMTSTITTIKTPPKNRDALFDFALAGPAFGLIASISALVVGCLLTKEADPATIATFPQLPIQILQLSAFSSRIIETVLGQDVLSIPTSNGVDAVTTTTTALANFSLHPVAVAGFLTMIINALSLLPIGITDGGRIHQAENGRRTINCLGVLSLIGVFVVGVFQNNDVLLVYGLFACILQQGNELPLRNEIDEISVPRKLLRILASIIALWILVPTHDSFV